jgi:phosphate-selective porin OprO/OprP
MKKTKKALKWVGLTLAGLSVALSSNVMAAVSVETKGGLKVYHPSDESYWFGVGGRLNFDETIFFGNRNHKQEDVQTGANIRRAFLKLHGGVGDCWSYNLTLNFNGHLAKFEDAWINYSGLLEESNLRIGQFTPLATIDGWSSYGTDNDGMFLEPALATTAFSGTSWFPGYTHSTANKALGIMVDMPVLDMFTIAATVYQPQQNPTLLSSNTSSTNNFQNPGRSDRVGAAARLTFSPVHTCDTVYHIGLLGRYQSMNNHRNGVPVAQRNLFGTTPEAVARNTTMLLNTGDVRARSYNLVAIDALGMWGPVTLAGEYHHTNVQRLPVLNPNPTVPGTVEFLPQNGNVKFHGWHVQAGYMITGESREYDFNRGTLHNPTPCCEYGAWEIAARYSELNLINKEIYGGSEHNLTVGVNWFINENVKLAANYIRADVRATNTGAFGTKPVAATPLKRHLDILGMRFQVVF